MMMRRLALLSILVVVATGTTFGQRLVAGPDGRELAVVWETPQGASWKASADGGATFTEPRPTSFDLMLRYARFDPLAASPHVPAALEGAESTRLWIVQYAAPPLPSMRDAVRAAGATRLFYLPHQADIVDADPARARALRALPFVRWVGPYRPAYRMFPADLEALHRRGAGVRLERRHRPEGRPRCEAAHRVRSRARGRHALPRRRARVLHAHDDAPAVGSRRRDRARRGPVGRPMGPPRA